MFDVRSTRNDFPILSSQMNGKPLVYLDNASTSQKPSVVIDTTESFYKNSNSNIHRGVFKLSEEATEKYEATRDIIANFLNASKREEIIFTKGVTEAINLIAHGFSHSILNKGDEILITEMEHHANIVPWQIACEQSGSTLKIVPTLDDGTLDYEAFSKLLNEKTKLFCVVHISNALGTINPIKKLINKAHQMNVPVLIDGAQSAPHLDIDLQSLDCEFFVLSGHKLFGPTGVGVLYGKESWLEKLPPYQSGGDMIEKVDFDGTTYKSIPGKFEAGTPNISGVLGLSMAVNYLCNMDFRAAISYENDLLVYATKTLESIPGLRIIGTAADKASIISFVFNDIHAHDVGTFLDAGGVAIRTGHHCTMPLLNRFNLPATARASFAFYNTFEEIEILSKTLHDMRRFFL